MTELRKELSTFDLAMVAIGGTIGSGIFLTPSLVAQHLPSPAAMLLAWILGGVIALCGALTFAELGGMMPGAGGMYVYLSNAYSPFIGFLFGWAYFLVVNTGGIAALCITFATYLSYLLPIGPGAIPAVAIAGLLVLTLLNIGGVRAGGVAADLFTLLKLAGIGAVILIGLVWGSGENPSAPAGPVTDGPTPLGGLAAAMIGVLWSYGGWQHASFAAGEARHPTRSVPRAMIIGAATVTAVYLLANVAYLLLLPPSAIAASPRLAADAVGAVFGPAGGGFIALVIFLSTFGSVGIYTLTAPRIYYAMARDGVFFRSMASVHPRFGTPAAAIAVQSAWATLLILFWQTFDRLISYVVFTDWIFFGLTGAAVFLLRKKLPGATRPYRTFGYPFTPLLFTGISAWFVAATLIEQPVQAWAGLILLALGVPVYISWKRKTHAPS